MASNGKLSAQETDDLAFHINQITTILDASEEQIAEALVQAELLSMKEALIVVAKAFQ